MNKKKPQHRYLGLGYEKHPVKNSNQTSAACGKKSSDTSHPSYSVIIILQVLKQIAGITFAY